ncbi:MAG: hypothetical protein WAR22_05100 [Desulfomonilia bacterium]
MQISLTRREILEELIRLGIRSIDKLKKACREFETYQQQLVRQRPTGS